MPISVRLKPGVEEKLGQLSPALRAQIDKRISAIAGDPDLMTRTFTHGLRLWDGMAMADEKSYYVQFQFHFVPGRNEFEIYSVVVMELHGPH